MTTTEEYIEENYETRRVSNFLDWAHKKLNEEVKQIDEMEAEYGTAEWTKPSRQTPGRVGKAFSIPEKLEIISSVDALRDQGFSNRSACKVLGISKATYLLYRQQCKLNNYKRGGAGIST